MNEFSYEGLNLSKPEKPNLLFIFTDEQRQDTLGVYGNKRIKTPNLDNLASVSVVFKRAYVTQTVCTPSRASIMTGLYPHTTGCVENNIPLDRKIPTIAEIVGGKEYRKAYFGKWHLGDEEIPQHGFEENWVSTEEMYKPYYTEEEYKDAISDYHIYLTEQGYAPDAEVEGRSVFSREFCARLPKQHSKSIFLADRVCSFLRNNRNYPFLVYLNFLEPHMPFFGPYDGMYKAEEVLLPDNFYDSILASDTPIKHRWMIRSFAERSFPDRNDEHGILKTEWEWRNLISRYWGLVSLVDDAVGQVLNCLMELGLDENTIIIYTRDNGDMMGSHGMVTKMTRYEEVAKIPLLMKIPWLTKSRMWVDNPVSQIDLVPTILDLMGIQAPRNLQGQSWYACLKGVRPWGNDPVVVEWIGREGEKWHATGKNYGFSAEELDKVSGAEVRTIIDAEGWKLSLSEVGENELFNLNEDPGERQNLINKKKYNHILMRLYEALQKWQKDSNDKLNLVFNP